MALATSQFTQIKRFPIGPGLYMVTGRFTGPAAYTSGGEDFTNAKVFGALGIRNIKSLVFTDLIDENNTALAVAVNFDHNRTSTSQGKIRFTAATRSHSHDLSIIGGQGAAGTDTVTAPDATDILGKQDAGDTLVLGADVATKGGVVASTQQEAGAEVTASTDLSGYLCHFVAYGC